MDLLLQKVLLSGVFLLLAFCGSAPLLTAQINEVEWDKVSSFAEKLNLSTLAIDVKEIRFDQEIDPEKRRSIAKQLLNAYAVELSIRREQSIQLVRKTKKLLATYPDLANSTHGMALAQSSFFDLEIEFRNWWMRGKDPSEGKEIKIAFEELRDELLKLEFNIQQEFEKELSDLQASFDSSPDARRSINEIENALISCHYLLGWAHYFLGVQEVGNQKATLKTAAKYFRLFLQLDPTENLLTISLDQIDLTNQWNAQGLLGLALSERAMEHHQQSDHCFKWFEKRNPLQTTQADLWRLRSSGYASLTSILQGQLSDLGSMSDPRVENRLLFWNEVVLVGNSFKRQNPALAKKLVAEGLAGLGRDFDANTMSNLVRDLNLDLQAVGFRGNWLSGFLSLENSLGSNLELVKTARNQLQKALELTDADTRESEKVCCKILLAKSEISLKNFSLALKIVNSIEFDSSDNIYQKSLKQESAWIEIVALSELSEDQTYAFQALRAINDAIVRFPDSNLAQRAEFQKIKLENLNRQPKEALIALQDIGENHPLFFAAQLESIEQKRKQLGKFLDSNKNSSDAERSAEVLANNLAESALKLIQRPGITNTQKIQSLLIALDGLLESGPPAMELTQSLLRMLRNQNVDDLAISVESQIRYTEFRFAILTTDMAQQEQQANWLVSHAPDAPSTLSALIQLAQIEEARLRDLSEPTDLDFVKLAARYQNLISILGNSDQDIQNSANHRIATARLTELEIQLEKLDSAGQRILQLRRLFPGYAAYIRLDAMREFKLGEFENSLPKWKQLARGIQ
ncbi:MAG: hypothetical protein AAF939_15220, partial [Planctomycetota bacterium]